MLNKALPTHPSGGISSGSAHMHRSASESIAYPAPPPISSKTGSFSHFLRRKKFGGIDDSTPPPPTPPKDPQVFSPQFSPQSQPRSHHREDSSDGAYLAYHSHHHDYDNTQVHDNIHDSSRGRGNIISDVIHITREESDMVVIEPQRLPTALEAKWANEPYKIADPAERARRRIEAKRQKEEEERQAVEEEAERQRLLKLRKQATLEKEMEEECLRKAMLEKEVKEATAARMRRERQMEEEEEIRAREAAEKKRVDKERRTEEVRRLEEWRTEKQRRSEEMVRRKEEEIETQEKERKARVKMVEAKIRKDSTTEMMTGWVTVQTSDALALMWRRRFFKFVGSTMYFYPSPKVDEFSPVLYVELRGHVGALREWHEGYEELEYIPHSFAIEFTDGRGPWSMFSDSEEDKVRELCAFASISINLILLVGEATWTVASGGRSEVVAGSI